MAKKATASASAGFSFGSVPVVEAAPKASPKSSLGRFEMQGVSILKDLKAVVAVIGTALGEVEDTLENEAKNIFVLQGTLKGKRPENFNGFEGTSEASMLFSKRASNRALTADEQALLTTHDIPFETETLPVTYSFNPEFIRDPEWRAKIEKALGGIPGLEDGMALLGDKKQPIIKVTPVSSVSTVSDKTVEAIFTKKENVSDEEAVALATTLLPVVTTFAIKSKATTNDFKAVLGRVSEYLSLPALITLVEKTLPASEAKPTKRKAAA